MKRYYHFIKIFFVFLSIVVLNLSSCLPFFPMQAHAAVPVNANIAVTIEGANPNGAGGTGIVYSNSPWLTMWFKADQAIFDKTSHYQVHFEEPNCAINCTYDAYPNSDNANLNSTTQLVAHITANGQFNSGTWKYKLGNGDTTDSNLIYQGTFQVYPAGGQNGLPALELPNGSNIEKGDTQVPVYILNTAKNSTWTVWIDGNHSTVYTVNSNPNGGDIHGTGNFSTGDNGGSSGQHKLCMTNSLSASRGGYTANGLSCDYSIDINITPYNPGKGQPVSSNPTGSPAQGTTTGNNNNTNGSCNPACTNGSTCINAVDYGLQYAPILGGAQSLPVIGGSINNTLGSYICVPLTPTPAVCSQDYQCLPYKCGPDKRCSLTPIPTATDYPTPNPLCPNQQCETALGMIPTQPAGFIAQVLVIILSFAGGIAVLLIINSGYHIMVSGGNPEKLQEAREGLTSALVGLLFIIFSVAILQLIAISVLHIPGFSQ